MYTLCQRGFLLLQATILAFIVMTEPHGPGKCWKSGSAKQALLLRSHVLTWHKVHLVHKVAQGLSELVPGDDGDVVLGQMLS